ncbi:unnamed protein product [Rotaria sp. Silwood1]|nr:unnamed protein product [Rotaria sp. Silwood1]CAF1312787.1 unnamed protein product [Rotaria sp. Silwood1]CAF1314466.1 unnamed protein product [Rotaria sp. Silwood1]CAF3544112.1 unnamed protein product [Rotaria sp. Silwood1]CAF3549996.1 unnamed protein product [Rotaria sp. Silwood1]
MSAEQSLKNSYTYVGILLVLEGLSFLIFPHLTTKLLFLSPLETAQAERYARLAGLAIVVIGYYYCVAGKYTLIGFFRASVVGRMCILPIITAMIYFYSLEVSFLVFGIQDLLTAIWSYFCLKTYDEEQAKQKK